MPTNPYHHGDLRRALLKAARRLVVRKGAANVSLRAIAREAKVSAAAPYHHFADREALLAAVAASGFESLTSAMETASATSEGDDPLGRLQAVGIAYVSFAVKDPEIFRLMFSGLLSDRGRFPELQAASDCTWDVLLGLLPSGRQGAGEDILPSVALATWSTVHGLAFLLIEGMLNEETRAAEPEEIARQVTLVLGRGLKSFAV